MDQRTPAAACCAGCSIKEDWVGRTVVISVSGVLDMLTSPQLQAGIDAALKQDPAALVVDLTGVEFLAAAGMGVLVASRRKIAGFAVVASGPATARPLNLVGLAELVGLHATLDEARAALGR